MALDHLIRLTLRFHVASYRREIDLAIPAGSSIADIIDEVARLCEAPRISRPWRPCTAAGLPLDVAAPLEDLGLAHGSVVVLEPEQPRTAPVTRDAAEALVERLHPRALPQEALAQLAAVAGLVGLGLMAGAWLPAWAAATGVALGGLVLVLWFRAFAGVGAVVTVAAAAAGWWWVTGGVGAVGGAPAPEAAGTGAAAAGALGLAAAVALALLQVRHFGAGVLAALAALVAALGAGLATAALGLTNTPAVAGGAGGVLAGLIGLLVAPALSSAIAGLKVPRLPSAGQDLEVSDTSDVTADEVTDRATRAQRCHGGLTVGCCLGLLVSLVPLATTGGATPGSGAFALALIATVGGALGLHGLRHVSQVALWAQALVCAAALVAAAICAVHLGHPAGWITVGAALAVALTTPWWVPRITPLDPPKVAWVERAEALCLAVAFPLAVHLIGVFVLIRGLG